MLDLAIVGGKAVTPSGMLDADIGIQADRIALLAAPGSLPAARRTIDASGQIVMPGAIDIHFHCRAPAHPARGDFATETRAAAAGGVTTVFEMPISKPCCSNPEVFRSRRTLAEANVYVNFALYGAPGTLRREDVTGMAEEGAIGFKIFMHAAPPLREDEFYGLCIPGETELRDALALVKETGLRTSVHCESNDLLESTIARLTAEGRMDVTAHGASRPALVEVLAMAKLMSIAEDLGTPVHIAHLSCADALKVLRRYQRDGVDVTAETCPHYLLFTIEKMLEVGPYAKINPPLRSQADIDALWEGVLDGSLISVTTDHSPFLVEEKERARHDIWATPSGAPGVEELVQFVMTEALRGRMSIEKAVDLVSTNGAKLFNLYPYKGALVPGADADIAVYDPRSPVTIDRTKLFTKAKECDRLYDGMTMQGRVTTTIVNGKVVFDQGEIVGERGDGRFVRPLGLEERRSLAATAVMLA